MKKDRLHRLIEQELFRRASILVEARRIALAEHLLIEKEVGSKDFKGSKEIKQEIRDLIQQAEDAYDDGDQETGERLMKKVDELSAQYKLNPKEVKAKVKPTKSTDDDEETDADAEGNAESEPKKDSETEVGGVAPKSEPTNTNHDEEEPHNEPPPPEDGSADERMRNGEVTYDIQGKKAGEKVTKAIPQDWFVKWLEREKVPGSELKVRLVKTQNTARELTPPRGDDQERHANFREKQAGYQNKINAIKKVLTALQKKDNKDIEDHNKKQDRRKDHINNIVDVLSGGNPLLKTIVGLMADKLLKGKEKVNYTDDDDPYGDDY